jgi:Fe-Mn family superoxide dismutase
MPISPTRIIVTIIEPTGALYSPARIWSKAMSNDYSRRDFLATATAGAMLAALSPEALAAPPSAEPAPTAPIPTAFAPGHEPKPLPFDPAKLDGISEKLIRSHWENKYGGPAI